MHICFLCNEYPPEPHGGVGSFTQTLARALVTRGHRVTVAGYTTGAAPGRTDDRGVSVVRLPHAKVAGTGLLVNHLRLWRALVEIDRVSPVDIIEGPEASLVAIPRRLRVPAVIRMHGGHHFFAVTLGRRPSLQRSLLEERSFSRATNLCAVSRFVAGKTLELLRATGRPVEILPNPVDTDRFTPCDAAVQENLIVLAGRLCEKKGVRQLVQAMPLILDAVPDARLWLIGGDSRDPITGGSYAERLKQEMPVAVAERVQFFGAVAHDDMPALLAQAAVCVYPSHMEALPLAWLEAMAMGKCVVASCTGPGPEVIDHDVSGLLCDPHVPAAIATQVVRALRDRPLRARLGRQARARAVGEYSEAVMVGRNEQFYLRCREAVHA